MRYQVEIVEVAQRQIRDLSAQIQKRLVTRIRALADNPRPSGVVKLKGRTADHYRIRVGDYRVVYTIEDDVLLVLVVSVGHRREISRDL
jgi:mRNA interferase RelE/StbE